MAKGTKAAAKAPVAGKATKGAKAAVKAAPKAQRESLGDRTLKGAGIVDPKKKIKVLVQENPKRAGSAAHKRFAMYKSGMTVAEALHKGVTNLDVRWDAGRGFIALQ